MSASSLEISDAMNLVENDARTFSRGNGSGYQSLESVDDSLLLADPMDNDDCSTPLIEKINHSLFSNTCPTNSSNFPLLVKFPYSSQSKKVQISDFLKQFEDLKADIQNHDDSDSGISEIFCTDENKSTIDNLIYALKENNDTYPDNIIDYGLDYSSLVSHPGIMFIKNLSKSLITDSLEASTTIHRKDPDALSNPLFSFLLENSTFGSLKETKIFTNESSLASSCFAIVTFENYLDVDVLIGKLNKLVPNTFNENPIVPLYLNKYLHKRERVGASPSRRSSLPTGKNLSHNNVPSTVAANEFDTIFMENLSRFFPPDLTTTQLNQFVHKFTAFEVDLDAVYLPCYNNVVEAESAEAPNPGASALKVLDYGYIKFSSDSNILVKTLTILYYMNNLTWQEFLAIDEKNLEPLTSVDSDNVAHYNSIKLTIAQYKHNSVLYRNSNLWYFSVLNDSLISNPPNPVFIHETFSELVNYQETNIYVNNLPVLFDNNDELWESFWEQFGAIKSAKIIKPQFYKEESDEEYDFDGSKQKPNSGRIGFVFYNDFKMALRLVLLTNNKLVNVNGSSNIILIQSSFALQKPNTKSNMYQAPPQHNVMMNNQQSYQPVLKNLPIVPPPMVPNVLQYPFMPYMDPRPMLQQMNSLLSYYNLSFYQNAFPPGVPQRPQNYGAQQGKKYRGKKNRRASRDNIDQGYVYTNYNYPYSGYNMPKYGYYYNEYDYQNGNHDDVNHDRNEEIEQENKKMVN